MNVSIIIPNPISSRSAPYSSHHARTTSSLASAVDTPEHQCTLAHGPGRGRGLVPSLALYHHSPPPGRDHAHPGAASVLAAGRSRAPGCRGCALASTAGAVGPVVPVGLHRHCGLVTVAVTATVPVPVPVPLVVAFEDCR